ncbi:hypothetical protein BRADI_2g61454v3 [Brachypodium distachyon]|uniref:Uncharacterized protein n=1 Tax=Brachypodium distachyon TaxID=15368 RepID=A0A2K2DH75_BRADI|nr:hypothetical protein BRADI_2g61454v3 [Brachypodium distachyon]PNT73641.1 hypothetical protein BRADI_2g61454v3 [Brachypodium distachyon]
MALASVQPTRAAHRQSISSPIEVSLAGEGGQRPVSPPRRRRPSRRRRFLGQVYGDPFAAARPGSNANGLGSRRDLCES